MRSAVTAAQVAQRLRQPIGTAQNGVHHVDVAAEHSLILGLCKTIPRRRAFTHDEHFKELSIALCEHRLLVFAVQEEDVLQSRRQQVAEEHAHGTNPNQERGTTATTASATTTTATTTSTPSTTLGTARSAAPPHHGGEPKVLVTDAAVWYPYILLLRLLLRDAALVAMLMAKFPDLCAAVASLALYFCSPALWDEEADNDLLSSANHSNAGEDGGDQSDHDDTSRGSTSSTAASLLGNPRVAQQRLCVELAAAVQRLTKHPDSVLTFMDARVDHALVPLLAHADGDVVMSAAHALLALALSGTAATREVMASSSAVSLCLQALDRAQGEQQLALLRLLLSLSDQAAARKDMVLYDALRLFTQLLQVVDLDVRLAVVGCIERLCADFEDEVRLSGLIPQLAKILANYVHELGDGRDQGGADSAGERDDGDAGGGAEGGDVRDTAGSGSGGVGNSIGEGGDFHIPVSSSTITSLPPPIALASPAKHSALRCAVMSALTALCVQEIGAVQVQECNVIYVASRLLVHPVVEAYKSGALPSPSAAGASRPVTPATARILGLQAASRPTTATRGKSGHDATPATSTDNNNNNNNATAGVGHALQSSRATGAPPGTPRRNSRVYRPPTQTLLEQGCAMRLLRFLFSAERNRRYFKRLFPPDLFSWFIDVGHYKPGMQVYLRLVRHLYRMTPTAVQRLERAVEDTNVNKQPSRHVLKYGLLEKLGEGSFGCVYRAVRADTEHMYAVKEIPLRNPALFGQTDGEQAKAIQRIENEVKIMQGGLRHPNVVKYETSFVLTSTLFIVMEMVEGASLQDHFNALVEKQQTMDERRVWRIFVQICNGIHYMHREKRVVHRDLSPSNVMLGWYDKVTIVDFGLSRQRNTGNTLMESSVGTLSYSCPEIVTNQKYNDKADIWALGCLLYQLATLRPPFATTNMLALAKRIVEGTYDPIPSTRSEMLRETVSVCLTPDPDLRPDITEVCQAIGPAIMVELDVLARTMEVKDRMIERERTLKRRFRRDAKAAKVAMDRLLTASQRTDEDEQAEEEEEEDVEGEEVVVGGRGGGDDRNAFRQNSTSAFNAVRAAGRGTDPNAGPAGERNGARDGEAGVHEQLWRTDTDGAVETEQRAGNQHEAVASQRKVGDDSYNNNSDDDDGDDSELEEDVFGSPTATQRLARFEASRRRQHRIGSRHVVHSASTSALLDPRARAGLRRHGRRRDRSDGTDGDGDGDRGSGPLGSLAEIGAMLPAHDATSEEQGSRTRQQQQQHQSRRTPSGRQRTSTRPSWRQVSPSPSGNATPRVRSAARGRPSSSTAPAAGIIRLPASKLKPVADPIVLLLTQLKKVMFVCMQAPESRANPARHVVVRFQQVLFRPTTSSAAMKDHLHKLQHAVPSTIVDIDFGMAGRVAREIAMRSSTEAARALSRLQRQALFSSSSSSSGANVLAGTPSATANVGSAATATAPVTAQRVAPTPMRARGGAVEQGGGGGGSDQDNSLQRGAATSDANERTGEAGGADLTSSSSRVGDVGGDGGGVQHRDDGAFLVRVPSMEDGTRLTSDAFVARNTLTYQQLHRIIELELQRCGYYDAGKRTGRTSRASRSSHRSVGAA